MTPKNNNYKYSRGSEWGKWDLHVHAPSVTRNNNFEGKTESGKWERYVEKIETLTNVVVLGITDYFSIEGYKKLKQFKDEGRIENIDLLLPNIELRILPVTSEDTPINLHLVISPEIVEEIDNLFFSRLEYPYASETFKCTKDDLIKLGRKYRSNNALDENVAYKDGVEQFKTNLKQIKEILDKSAHLKENVLVGVSNSSYDGNSGIQHSSLASTREEIYRFSNFVFSGNPNDRKYFLGEGVDDEEAIKRKYDSLKSCVHGSDAHALNKICNPDLSRFTWIKATPTFNGLKQIIYEPKERVIIQAQNPSFEYDKPYFEQIEIDREIEIFENIEDSTQQVYFEKNNISLSKNLVAIIGGRGAGKSLLVNYLASTFNKFDNPEKVEIFSNQDDFIINYAKNNIESPDIETYHGDSANELDFLFIHQNKLKNISDKKTIGREIKKLLSLEDLHFSPDLSNNINSLLDRIQAIKDWFEEEDEDGDIHHDENFVNEFKDKYEKLLKSITTRKNKEKLEKYTKNIDSIKDIENLILKLERLKERLCKTKEEFNNKISDLNEHLPSDNQIEIIDFSDQTKQINKNITYCEAEKTKKEKENEKIKDEFSKEGFSGDLSALLENAKAYKNNAKWAEGKLLEITENKSKLRKLLEERGNLGDLIKNEYVRQEQIITESWGDVIESIEKPEHRNLIKKILEEREIEISGEIIFHKNLFYEKIKDYLDLRYFPSIEQEIGITDIGSYEEFIKNKLSSYIEGDNENKTKKNLGDLFFNLQERRSYLYAQPKVTYRNKPLTRLSVGQRGTVYLCLKLATGAFSKPIIFDQPEDDLDNEFITQELIAIFKELKKYRQIIIVTHNANLVVNADAEQVIVAHNNNEKLNYSPGALEDENIITAVCDILEGGEEAFKKRKSKYNFTQATT